VRNKWTWIFFGVGTTLGSLLFTCAQGPDASDVLKLPREAKVTRVEQRGLGEDAWFQMPATKTPEEWLSDIARTNGFEKDTDDRWRMPSVEGLAKQDAFVEYANGEYHASRSLSIPDSTGLK
jgi:hypothetical protein